MKFKMFTKPAMLVMSLLCFYSFTFAQIPDYFECAYEDTGTSSQNGNSNNNCSANNGRIHTPDGVLRCLIVFAGFEGFENSPSLGGWNNFISNDFQLPEYVNISPNGQVMTTDFLFNSVSDFSDFPNSKSTSNILNIMSKPNRDFKFIGDVFTDANDDPTLVTIDPTGCSSWPCVNQRVADRMMELRPSTGANDPYWSQFDQRENFPNYASNNIESNPDGIIDFVIYMYLSLIHI